LHSKIYMLNSVSVVF